LKFYQGKFRPSNPGKYRGDVNNIIYRSSWELKFLLYADRNPNIIEYSSEEIVIPYLSPVDKRWHRYFPDFLIKVKTKDGQIKSILIEVKPHKQTKPPEKGKRVTKRYITEIATWGVNEAKWKAAEEYCKDRKWEFKILTEKELNIK
jgi:hypothetical protein